MFCTVYFSEDDNGFTDVERTRGVRAAATACCVGAELGLFVKKDAIAVRVEVVYRITAGDVTSDGRLEAGLCGGR